MKYFKLALLGLVIILAACIKKKEITFERFEVTFNISKEYNSDANADGFYYEIFDLKNNIILVRKKWMMATGPNEVSLSEFEGKSIDSVFYLTLNEQIMAAYDLKSQKELSFEQITDSLKQIIGNF